MTTNIQNNNIKTNFSKWMDYYYPLENCIITKESIQKALNKFYLDKILNLDKDQSILIFFKVRIKNGPFRNISNLQKVNKLEFYNLIDIFIEYWNIKSSEYNEYPLIEIVFTYYILPTNLDLEIKNSTRELKKQKTTYKDKNKSLKLETGLLDTINFGGYSLPGTMDITEWGHCDFYNNYTEAIVYKKQSKGIYYIKLHNNYLEVDLKIDNKSILYFKDTLLDINCLGTFKREIKEQTYEFLNGKLKTKSKKYKTQYIKPLLGDIYLNDKFLTMDLETRIRKGKMEVYHVSIFDGISINTFYLSDYTNSEELLKYSILSILIRKYNGYKVYLHNFSNFDSVYLLRVITSLSNNVNIIMKDNKLINLQFKFGDNKYNIVFRDSFLLLPSSLKKLTLSFNVEEKLIFPYAFVNDEKINLDYKGKVPEFKYFENIKIKEYKEYCNNFKDKDWNLREETLKYCNQDVKSLYLVIKKFSQQIFDLFRISVINSPTLSSLSFTIYRTIFMKDFKIPIITGELYNFIKKGYTGGAVDVYKPFGNFIYRYDVNSLYPFIMKNFPMPINEPIFIEGDISDFNLKELAFIEVEVEAPENLNIPFLQTKIKSKKGGYVTISPLGSWTGIYSCNEIKKSIALGYKFKYLRALKFEQGYIFEEFVSYFFNLKKNSLKNSSEYTIAKFILNSLSGRFALEPELDKHVIVDDKKVLELVKYYTINSLINLGNGKNLVSYKINNDSIDTNKNPNVSIVVSANITANARTWMNQFKQKNLFYSDTDSIDTNVLLDPKYVGNELGQLKLEHFFSEAVYLAPKVYGGITPKYEIVKIKGLKNPIPYKELLPLLYKNKTLELKQEKWLKDIGKGHISIHNEIYTLMVTENKRKLIYDKDNKFIETKPLKIKNEIIIE